MRSEIRILRLSFGSLGVALAALAVGGCNLIFGIDEHDLLGSDATAEAQAAEAGPDAESDQATPAEAGGMAVSDTGADGSGGDVQDGCTGVCSSGLDAASDVSTDAATGGDVSAGDAGGDASGDAYDAAVVDATVDAGSSCSAQMGKSCGSCGGTYNCAGTCSVATPANFGKSCGSCGGVYACNGACSVATPSNYGQSCGSCAGKYQCDGTCSVATPSNYGQSCNGGCSYINCSGICNSTGGGPIYGGSCPTSTGTAIVVGTTYGNYAVQSITLGGAPPGVYTFTIVSGDAGLVTVLKDGVAVTTLNYNWQTTVSGASHNPVLTATFAFPGYFTIVVLGGSGIPNGTLDLYDLNADSIFDGSHYISTCCQ
jgi:hypothetical protein